MTTNTVINKSIIGYKNFWLEIIGEYQVALVVVSSDGLIGSLYYSGQSLKKSMVRLLVHLHAWQNRTKAAGLKGPIFVTHFFCSRFFFFFESVSTATWILSSSLIQMTRSGCWNDKHPNILIGRNRGHRGGGARNSRPARSFPRPRWLKSIHLPRINLIW